MILVFFLSLVSICVTIHMQRINILVIHSYHVDYIWTREINAGLQRVLHNFAGINIQYHYMDTKKKSGKENLRRAALAAQDAIKNIQPRVLIAFDDYAQQALAKHVINDPNIDLVFAGLNGQHQAYGYDKATNVTGILERKPIAALKALLLDIDIQQGRQRTAPIHTFFIADNSLSAQKDGVFLRSNDWSPLAFDGVLYCETFADWKELVLKLHHEVDYFLVGPYRKLKRSLDDTSLVPATEVITWTRENTNTPLIGMNVFNSSDGVSLSIGVSPFEQGEVAANMALAIIEGTPPKDIPIQQSQLYVVAMRNAAMQKQNLKVGNIYVAFAKATNNYYE